MTSASARTVSSSAPFLGDRAGDPALVAERVAVARLRVAPDEDLVARLEEEHLGPDPAALERAAHRARTRAARRPTGRRGRSRRGRSARGSLGHELGEVGQQLARQVVDHRVAEVLEELGRGGLAAARQAADDDDVRGVSSSAAGRDGPPSGSRPRVYRMRRDADRSLAAAPDRRRWRPRTGRTWTPSTNGLTRSPPGVTRPRRSRSPRIASRRVARQPRRGHDADLRQPDEHDRELHDEPEREEQRGHEVEVLAGRISWTSGRSGSSAGTAANGRTT